MMKVFLVLYQVSSMQAGFGTETPTGVVLQFATEEDCLEAVAIFNSIGEQGSDVHYAPESWVLRAECKATNPTDND
jgi:radical SAM superfamily enzyme with C-terminal helix-hairpin-helix motif